MEVRRGVVIATLVSAWLGWGFDVFDGLLFSYVATPTLRSLMSGATPEEITAWLAYLNAIFLVGWGVGGILFGRITDRFGRTRTLMLTMLVYSIATALCAACTNLPSFIACRVFASLGIGGEWAAGAALVAEVVSDRARPIAGAILYTASPAGMWIASKVTRFVVAGEADADGWRKAFLLGLVPAAFAFAIRYFVEEPERWEEHKKEPAQLREIFSSEGGLLRRTVTGAGIASVALVGWWGILSFIPKLAREWCAHLPKDVIEVRVDEANDGFILGGVLGTLATVPVAMALGRRTAFGLYFALAIASCWTAFGAELALEWRLRALFLVGLTVFGVFGLFPFYLPELFPTRLRGTGAGFCYNVGRFVTAVGVFTVGKLAGVFGSLTKAVLAVSAVYVIGLALLPFAIETRGRKLE